MLNKLLLNSLSGIRNVSKGTNVSEEVLLRVPLRDTCISTLSDDSFTEEECEELCHKMKSGMYKRLTLVDLEKKVKVLHEDITKHRIVKEIALLQDLIERANEKGWRKEYPLATEYLERKQLLQTETEQSHMLHDYAAEEFFPEDDIDWLTSSESSLGDKPEIAKSMSNGAAASSMMDFSGHGKQLLEKAHTNEVGPMCMELNFAESFKGTLSRLQEAPQMVDFSCREPGMTGLSAASNETKDLLATRAISSAEYWWCSVQESQMKNAIEDTFAIMDMKKGFNGAAMNTSQVRDFSLVVPERNRFGGSSSRVKSLTNIALGTNSTEPVHGSRAQENPHKSQNQPVDLNLGVAVTTTEKKVEADAQVIYLSSDDEGDSGQNSSGFNNGSGVWYYEDPSGYQQGPFSLEMLKQWSDAHYFPADFKVWMAGQNRSHATELTGILRWMFHDY
ncbi:hypothetical protein SAY87_002321 [Trapa incisa]|uniref:GYF domain-containing protein n=1 Tax=Trapa incisa TaxID=236973 RepID=A0AAN7PTZ7_9MYRT|nr:hypothetical protein SAY87_002321 [Trapa incisa]